MIESLNTVYSMNDVCSAKLKNYQMKKLATIDDETDIIVGSNTNNVVSGEKLRKIQQLTLQQAKEYIMSTFGPMGSNTKIIKGYNRDSIIAKYSKDGLKVLSSILNSGPIEASIIEELIEMARHVEKEVGDGTTSTVILASLIFDHLMDIMSVYDDMPPFQIVRKFNEAVSIIKEAIKKDGEACTLKDIYDISMVSTNGNEEVSNNISYIYNKYGMDVDISVGISNTTDSLTKDYDGLVITEGMSDPAFINNRENGTAEIRNAHVYHFSDPVDTPEMIALFESIIYQNIIEPATENEPYIPTVIVCPRISKDTSSYIKKLVTMLYEYDNKNMESEKPPILIITNVVASDELIMDDIANLCGCKSIHKYIDPNNYQKDLEQGLAADIETVVNFCGIAELVVSNSSKTKFINPQNMNIVDEDGNLKPHPTYTSLLNYLETEIENSKPTDSAAEVGLLKKRLNALKANTVDYLVGGITVSDRDQLKDLVEDAVKNCASAAKYGVGRSANFEGLIHSLDHLRSITTHPGTPDIDRDIAYSIYKSYWDISRLLYRTIVSEKDADDVVATSIYKGNPYDISGGFLPKEPSDNIKCSIMLDVNVLDTMAKIVTMMVTCNQCLLQATNLNTY